VTSAQLDPVLFAGRSLYLEPYGKAAEPGYGVLRTALAQKQRWGLGRMVLGDHRQVVVRAASTKLILHVLHYPEQVRICPQTVWPLESAPAEELRLAGLLVEAASGNVDWTAYPDPAAEELKSLIDAKLAGQAVAETVAPPRILSLLEALQQSVGVQNGKGTAPAGAAKAARERSRWTA
jgi:non-homologous end joining protein Ku